MTAAIIPGVMGASTVDLGSACNFAILSKSGISTTGTTHIIGNIGVSPIAATAITGFGLTRDSSNQFSISSRVNGRVYAANYAAPTPSMMTTAVSNMQTAYTDAAGRAAGVTELGAGNIGGLTLAPGVYKWSSGVTIPTDLTLSGGSNDVWIFQIAQTLDISSGKKVILSGGAQAKNIYWVVADKTTLETGSVFNGNILDKTAIVLNTGATLNGRALAQTAVTLDANTVNSPSTCSSPPAPAVKPVAKFIGTPISGRNPLNVQFTDQSTNTPSSWKWEYQKSGTSSWTQFSSAQSPSFVFSSTGTYSVRLTATNAGGSDSRTWQNYITVTTRPAPVAKPVAKFIGTPISGRNPLNVQFTDQSTNTPSSWKWEYQKSGTCSWTQFSSAQSPSFVFSSTGTYSVRLTATNAGGSDSRTWQNYITVTTRPAPVAKPVAKFIGTPISGRNPLNVQFTDQSTNTPSSWKWEYQKSGTCSWTQFSSAQSPSFIFSSTGTYSVRLTATNAGGSDSRTWQNYITVTTRRR